MTNLKLCVLALLTVMAAQARDFDYLLDYLEDGLSEENQAMMNKRAVKSGDLSKQVQNGSLRFVPAVKRNLSCYSCIDDCSKPDKVQCPPVVFGCYIITYNDGAQHTLKGCRVNGSDICEKYKATMKNVTCKMCDRNYCNRGRLSTWIGGPLLWLVLWHFI